MRALHTYLLLAVALCALAQPRFRLETYDDLSAQASGVSRIVRDRQGMIWMATADGLFRFDGYDFRNFKSHSGDGIDMPTNNISSMYSSSEGSVWCIMGGRAFLFDTRFYNFVDVLAPYERQSGRTLRISKLRPLACGTTWLFTKDSLMLALDDTRPTTTVQLMAEHVDPKHVTAVCDGRQRSWVLTSRQTFLHHRGRLTTFDQSYQRIIVNDRHVWLVAADGTLARYDERLRRPRPWTHPLLTTAVTGHATLSDKTIALCTEGGLLLLSPDGRTLTPTAATWPVAKVAEDADGRLWLLDADKRLYVLSGREGGGTLTAVSGDDGRGVRLGNFNMHSDKYGTLWFFADSGDTYYYDRHDPAAVLHRYDQGERIGKVRNTIYDGQGGCWFLRKEQLCRLTFQSPQYSALPLRQPDMVRCLVTDGRGRLLVGSKNDEAVTLFTSAGERIGWLCPDGTVSPTFQPFGSAVYSGLLAADGTLWLGTKSDGIFRLRPRDDGSFAVSHFAHDAANPASLPDNEVYAFATDSRGRLWVATRNGGLCCAADPQADELRFAHAGHGLPGWTTSADVGVKSLLVLPDGLLLVGAYDGLYVGDVSGADLRAVRFRQHRREASRAESLSSSNITDMVRVSDGRIFLSTGDGGVNELLTADLTASQFRFRHYDLSTGFPSDVTLAMVEADSSLWVTAAGRLIELRLQQSLRQPDVNTYLMRERPAFSAASPARLAGSRWVFGADDGALLIDLSELRSSSFVPPLIVTGVSKEGGPTDYGAGRSDTILLSASERDVTIWFSALDYEDTRQVVYAYRMSDDSRRPWTYLGQNHSIAFSQMKPGTYHITIRSTNSSGVWCNNERRLTVVVTPTFWETPWAWLLIAAVLTAVVAAVVSTALYIRRLKRKQHETLELYLSLLDHGTPAPVSPESPTPPSNTDAEVPATPPAETPAATPADDPLMQRLVGYVEDNLGNSDASIDDMAMACAVSRTSLHRKVKDMTGMSPMEFLREARIRKAMQQLAHTTKPVSEIAYACGFTDPKYFSKCFKSATDKTPTEFREG